MWAMHVCVARSSKTRTLKIRYKQKEKTLETDPRTTALTHILTQKTSYDPNKLKTPIRDPTALLFINSYLRVCYHMTLRSLSSYFSNNSYLKYLATGSKRDTEDCPSQRVPVRTICTRYLNMISL